MWEKDTVRVKSTEIEHKPNANILLKHAPLVLKWNLWALAPSLEVQKAIRPLWKPSLLQASLQGSLFGPMAEMELLLRLKPRWKAVVRAIYMVKYQIRGNCRESLKMS